MATKTLVDTDSVQTLTNKTLTAPVINSPELSGTITGTYTVGGTPTFTGVKITATGTTTARTLETRFAQEYWVEDFGAVGNGSTDDATALQAAFDAAIAAGPGTIVNFQHKTYITNAQLTITKGIVLRGQYGNDNATTGVPTASYSTIKWGGAASAMILWKDSGTNVIVRGGIERLVLDGNNNATIGLHIRSAAYSQFDIITYRTVTTGCLIDDGNSRLANALYFRRYEHFCGANAAAWNSNGLFIDGDVTGLFATSITCDWMECEVVNGAGLTFRAVDSCDFRRVKTYTRSGSGGTGKHVQFLKTVNFPTFHTQKNRIGLLIAGGDIYYGDFTKNNIIDCCVTESGSIVYESDATNKRTNHITRLIDFRDGASWATPQYTLIDRLVIPQGDFVGSGATPATLTTITSLVSGRAWSFANAATNELSASGIVPSKWNDGFIRGVRLLLGSVGSATGDVVFTVSCLAQPNTSGVGGTFQTVTATLTPAQNATNTMTFHELLFGSEEANNLEGLWVLRIERIGADAADTWPNAIHLYGVELLYRAEGPDSAGSYGPYGRFLYGGSDANP